MIDRIKAIWKYVLSFTKSEWTVEDYPLRYRYQGAMQYQEGQRFKPIAWTVQIVNWWQMSGGGDTKEAAYAELAKKIEDYKKDGKRLPRPGTELPIEFASCEGIERYAEIAEDFFPKILSMELGDVLFVSDESSLFDFHEEESNDRLNEKIKTIYGVDVSGVENSNLLEIFKRIAKAASARG